MGFGDKIRELRIKNGITQKQLAEFIFVSPQAVSKWEKGKSFPSVLMLPIIANVLGVHISDLFE